MTNKSFYENPNYINLVVAYDGDIKGDIAKLGDASVYIIDDNYAIISVNLINYKDTIRGIKSIVYIELNGIYTLTESPVEDSGATNFHRNPYLNLRGRGVVVAILDTGIDYLNEEFMFEDDTTRIFKIWDQTIESDKKKPEGFVHGSEYTEDEINKAIQAKKEGLNPYDIVPSKDTNGHGTKMAGIIGARGITREVVGAAPDCKFIIIKLKEASEDYSNYYFAKGDIPKYRNTDMLMALKYIYDLSFEINEPIVIYIPLVSNLGAHSGSSILERYLDTKVLLKNSIIAVASNGNEGNSDTHTSGVLRGDGDSALIEINCGMNQDGLFLQIYGGRPSKFRLGIVSPSGEVFENVNPQRTNHILINENQPWIFIYEDTSVEVTYDSPDEFTGDEKIILRIENIKAGIWKFRITGEHIVDGRYDAWILQRELLDSETKFLNPSPYSTVMMPGTSAKIITSAFYNQNNGASISESSRGYTRNGVVQPLLAAGGINAVTTKPGGGSVRVSGASVATAVLAGCCALILQWAVIDGNDLQMNSSKMQTYLMRGARKREGDIYPNRQWGYGVLDIEGVFNSLIINK